MRELVDPDYIETSLSIRRPIDGGVDVLRQFDAIVEFRTESGPEAIGSVTGWIGWQIGDEDLHDAVDAISADAEPLGAAAAAIIEANPEQFIDNVLLIDRMHLDPQWRGNRLSGAIIADLLALLRLNPDSTVVVLQPEPQQPAGGPYDDGPERDAALSRLTAACRDSGLERWRNTVVWGRPI
jgi:hypothetical protein